MFKATVKPLAITTLTLLALAIVLTVGASVWQARLDADRPPAPHVSAVMIPGQPISGLQGLAASLKWESDHAVSLSAVQWMGRAGVVAGLLFVVSLACFVVVALTVSATRQTPMTADGP